ATGKVSSGLPSRAERIPGPRLAATGARALGAPQPRGVIAYIWATPYAAADRLSRSIRGSRRPIQRTTQARPFVVYNLLIQHPLSKKQHRLLAVCVSSTCNIVQRNQNRYSPLRCNRAEDPSPNSSGAERECMGLNGNGSMRLSGKVSIITGG